MNCNNLYCSVPAMKLVTYNAFEGPGRRVREFYCRTCADAIAAPHLDIPSAEIKVQDIPLKYTMLE